MNEKPSKPTVRRPRSRKAKTELRQPTHTEIAERAYYLYLEEAAVDELGNWLRAERELSSVA